MVHKKIVINKNQSGDESEVSEQELQDIIVSAVGLMSVEDKPTLVAMLQKNGSLVTDVNTQGEILDASFKAIRDSASFRQDLEDYLVQQGSLNNLGEQASMDGGYYNSTGSDFLKSVFTKQNIEALAGVGIGYLGASLQAKAQKGQGQQAIDYTNAQANLEAIKLQQSLAGQGGASSSSGGVATTQKKNKWVLPVAIGGGVLLLGTILFFALRKKK